MKFFKRIVEYFENPSFPLLNYITGFLFIVLFRNFIEVYATKQDLKLLQVLIYTPFYIALASWFILLIHLLTKENIVKVSKIVLTFFLLILLPPILDLLITWGGTVRMRYGSVDNVKDIITNFLMMGGANNSPGQRIEISLSIVFSFIYFKIKTDNFFLSFLYAILIYTSIFLFGIATSLVNLLFQYLHISYTSYNSNLFLARLYVFVTLFCLVLIYYLHDRKKFLLIIGDIRLLRIIHYLVMIALGYVLYLRNESLHAKISPEINSDNFFYFILTPLSVIFAAVYTIISNNVEDIEIDKISNPNRPLVKGAIEKSEYIAIGYVSLVISFITAVLVNRACFIFISLIIGCYYIYSNPPLKLKRIPILSKMVIGLNSSFMALLGYTLFGAPILTFPLKYLFFLLVPLSLAANFLDIKDYEGDKAVGIKTLPVLMGIKNSKTLIGIFTLFCYAVLYYILNEDIKIYRWTLWGIPVLALAQLFFISQKKYTESFVFLTYLSGLAVVLFVLLKN